MQASGYGLPFFAGSEVGIEFYVAVVEWFEFLLVKVCLPRFGKSNCITDVAVGY